MINASIYLHLQSTIDLVLRVRNMGKSSSVCDVANQSFAWGSWARSSSSCQGEARNWKNTTENKLLEKLPSHYDSTNLPNGFWRDLVSVFFVVEGIFTPRFTFSLSSVFRLCLLQDRPFCVPWFRRLCRLQLSNYQVAVVMIKPRDGAQIIDTIACKCMWRSSIHIFRQWYAVL